MNRREFIKSAFCCAVSLAIPVDLKPVGIPGNIYFDERTGKIELIRESIIGNHITLQQFFAFQKAEWEKEWNQEKN